MINRILYSLKSFLSNRVVILFFLICILFSAVAVRLFHLQVVKGEEYNKKTTASVLRTLSVDAPRGNIYDRYGRPLAENKVAFCIKLDPNISITDKTLLNLVLLLEKNEEIIVDDFPISTDTPYAYLFNDNEEKELKWKKSSLELNEKKVDFSITAPELMKYLTTTNDNFKLSSEIDSENLSETTIRKIIGLKYSLFINRFRQYQPITIALDISDKTVAEIEENVELFAGVFIDVYSLRVYPEGKYFSHILGYTRIIDEKELEQYKEYGYSPNDLVGKIGVEKAFELDLKGTDGQITMEVDKNGKRISNSEVEKETNPIPGKNIYMTYDRDLQEKSYLILENKLTELITNRLTSSNPRYGFVSIKDLFCTMIQTNNISMKSIFEAKEGEISLLIQNIFASDGLIYDPDLKNDAEYINNIYSDGRLLLEQYIKSGKIALKNIIILLHEQKRITLTETEMSDVINNKISPLNIILKKLQEKDLTPNETGIEPCTGSLVVENIHTGEILASVTYPSYDNNMLSNNFDYSYYETLLNDPSTPLINRPFMQRKAPGSTFKMITAVAALEEGIITPTTTIYDKAVFTEAGWPHAKCSIAGSGSHGSINVTTAIEVSCNYFFYEISYRMGNASKGNRLSSIETLNKYMEAFGLNSPTGIEIEEYEPRMASPAYKEYLKKNQNPEATSSQTRWTDGDTIRAAIGQSDNNFTTANIAKYIATLAKGGTRYKMQIVSRIVDADGQNGTVYVPEIENELNISESTLNAVLKGMYGVTSGIRGTTRGVFSGFEIPVAGKSGTAQENKSKKSHTWFAGFAPYDDPQISIAVMIPNGDMPNGPSASVARDVIAEYMGLYNKSTTQNERNILVP